MAAVTKATDYINRRQYRRGINTLAKNRVGFRKAMSEYVQTVVRDEVSKFCKSSSSLQGKKSVDDISKFSWTEKHEELSKACPLLMSVLAAALTSNISRRTLELPRLSISAKPTIGTLMAIIMYQRRPRTLCDFQEMNSLQMWLSGCKREVRRHGILAYNMQCV